jgi:hypothetical protein
MVRPCYPFPPLLEPSADLIFSLCRFRRQGMSAPSWWSHTRASLKTILNKVLNFESEEDASIDPDIPLGQCRSAGLLASLQIESIHFLFRLSSSQLNDALSPSTTNDTDTPLTVTPRSTSSISLLTEDTSVSAGASHPLLLSEKALATSPILCSPLLLTSHKCLCRLLEHRDKHIQAAGFSLLDTILRFQTQVLSQIKSLVGTRAADWTSFQLFLSQCLEETIVPSLVDLLLRESTKAISECDLGTFRMILDPLLGLGSPEVIIRKVQVCYCS